MGKLIYLAGPITGQDYSGAVDWREAARLSLAEAGLTGLSPMRGKKYLEREEELSGNPEAYMDTLLSSVKGIVTRDRFDCQRSDLVLLNLLPATERGIVSIGSMVEIGWADSARVPIIVVMEKGNPHWHAFVHELCGWMVDSVEKAVTIAKAVLIADPALIEEEIANKGVS